MPPFSRHLRLGQRVWVMLPAAFDGHFFATPPSLTPPFSVAQAAFALAAATLMPSFFVITGVQRDIAMGNKVSTQQNSNAAIDNN